MIRRVETQAGDANGLGSIRRSIWKSKLPYKLQFDPEIVRIEPINIIEARAFGELDGVGLWTRTAENETTTHVRYDWKVPTTKPWMKLLSPIPNPFFRWNHDTIMNWGGEGPVKKSSCKLLNSKEN